MKSKTPALNARNKRRNNAKVDRASGKAVSLAPEPSLPKTSGFLLELARRNDPLGLAQRAWRNLNLIEAAYEAGHEAHVVTQLVQTLLALIVFPKEKKFFEHFSLVTLDELERSGWPRPKQMIGTTDTIGVLFRHMRNAVSHGNLVFYGDSKDGPNSRELSEIIIEFSDRRNESVPFDWRVTIDGPNLKRFLWHIFDFLDD